MFPLEEEALVGLITYWYKNLGCAIDCITTEVEYPSLIIYAQGHFVAIYSWITVLRV